MAATASVLTGVFKIDVRHTDTLPDFQYSHWLASKVCKEKWLQEGYFTGPFLMPSWVLKLS